MLLIHLLHHSIVVLAVVALLTVGAHATKGRVLVLLVAKGINLLTIERLLALGLELVKVHLCWFYTKLGEATFKGTKSV